MDAGAATGARDKITHILCQQGEGEASADKPSGEEWMRHFMAMVAPSGQPAPTRRSMSPNARYVATTPMRIFVGAAEVVDPAAGVLPGPDIDLVGRDERYDGCHFSETGLRHAAELWCEALSRAN